MNVAQAFEAVKSRLSLAIAYAKERPFRAGFVVGAFFVVALVKVF